MGPLIPIGAYRPPQLTPMVHGRSNLSMLVQAKWDARGLGGDGAILPTKKHPMKFMNAGSVDHTANPWGGEVYDGHKGFPAPVPARPSSPNNSRLPSGSISNSRRHLLITQPHEKDNQSRETRGDAHAGPNKSEIVHELAPPSKSEKVRRPSETNKNLPSETNKNLPSETDKNLPSETNSKNLPSETDKNLPSERERYTPTFFKSSRQKKSSSAKNQAAVKSEIDLKAAYSLYDRYVLGIFWVYNSAPLAPHTPSFPLPFVSFCFSLSFSSSQQLRMETSCERDVVL